jgi:hypothetical protein
LNHELRHHWDNVETLWLAVGEGEQLEKRTFPTRAMCGGAILRWRMKYILWLAQQSVAEDFAAFFWSDEDNCPLFK